MGSFPQALPRVSSLDLAYTGSNNVVISKSLTGNYEMKSCAFMRSINSSGCTGKNHETCQWEDGVLVVIQTRDLGISTKSAANLTVTFAQM